MSGIGDDFDLDETSFNLESVEMVEDDVDVHNELVSDDRVGVDVNVEVGIDSNSSNNHLPLPTIDEEKKKQFESRRDEILSCVPEEVKSRFGEIYFSNFGKFVGPVLVMNPYKVEPGPLREQWMTMFRNVSTIEHNVMLCVYSEVNQRFLPVILTLSSGCCFRFDSIGWATKRMNN
jgi:hypothetical protein